MFKKLVFSLLLGCLTSSAYVCADSHRIHQKPKKKKSYQTKHYEKKRAKGFKRTPETHEKMKAFRKTSFMRAPEAVPGSVDLSDVASPPEDQGQCGCCWAFSLTKALRSEYMIAGKDPGQLEFNYLIDNCGPGPQMNGCNGGDFAAAMSFESGQGPGLNKDDPFTGVDHKSCKNLAVYATAKNYSMLGDGDLPPTFKDIAFAIGVEKHVLSSDVAAASGEWEEYSSGIYDECEGSSSDIDHMINIVGYSCETSVDSMGNCVFDAKGHPAKGDGYLLVMNNWGNDWGVVAKSGHAGYMKMRMYDKKGNHCNAIATDALFFEIDPTENMPITLPTPPAPVPSQECSGFLCGAMACHLPWCTK